MRILITNDDGIWAPGLLPLVQWAKKMGQVTVAAPKVEQSGKSHGIELRKAFEVKKVDLEPEVEAYAVDSTPPHGMMKHVYTTAIIATQKALSKHLNLNQNPLPKKSVK